MKITKEQLKRLIQEEMGNIDPSDFEQSDEQAAPHEHKQSEMKWVEVNRLLDEIMKNVESVRKIMKSVELSR